MFPPNRSQDRVKFGVDLSDDTKLPVEFLTDPHTQLMRLLLRGNLLMVQQRLNLQHETPTQLHKVHQRTDIPLNDGDLLLHHLDCLSQVDVLLLQGLEF